MNNLNFTIATLTCNDRAVLFDVIDDVFSYTNLFNVNWIIYAQGCSERFIEKIKEKFYEKPCFLNLIVHPINTGYSKGMNAVWDAVKDYKFVLFLEDDWRLSPDTNKEWLNISIQLINERPELDIIYLRKYLTDQEKWQYGWTRNIHYKCFEGRLRFNYQEQMKNLFLLTYNSLHFQQIPNFMYTANPCIYRTDTYKRLNIFPMLEFDDIHNVKGEWNDSSKLSDKWGYSEALSMEKTADCFVLYLCDGIFYHNTA